MACGVDGALRFAGTGLGYLPIPVAAPLFLRRADALVPARESDAALTLGARWPFGVEELGRMVYASLRS